MAAQCWLNNTAPMYHQQINHQQQHSQPQKQQQTFISSSAYYGYMPVTSNNTMSPTTVNKDKSYGCNNGMMDMDVGEDVNRPKRLFDNVRDEHCVMRVKKRCHVQDDVPGFIHNFKRFRQGEQWLSTSAAATNCPAEPKHYGMAQVYHKPLLCLDPAANFDCQCISCHQPAAMTMTGNLKFQPTNCTSSNNELEDMLLLTHGCSSYHHYRLSQATIKISDCSFEEAEF